MTPATSIILDGKEIPWRRNDSTNRTWEANKTCRFNMVEPAILRKGCDK
jgi:hypothetical protein